MTRLPAELMNVIEDYLTQQTRSELRTEWSTSFACWENHCYTYEHLQPHERLLAYQDICDEDREYDEVMSELARVGHEAIELSSKQLEFLDFRLHCDLQFQNGDKEVEWKPAHEAMQKDWTSKTGSPTLRSRGFFSKHYALFKKHFGIDVAVQHSRWRAGCMDRWQGGGTERWRKDQEVDAYHSTSAYLTWPHCSSIREELDRYGELIGEDSVYFQANNPYEPTESGLAFPVVVPNQLSAKSIARFTRTMSVLDLQVVNQDLARRKELFVTEAEPQKKPTPTQSQTISTVEPQLMLLMRVDDTPIYP